MNTDAEKVQQARQLITERRYDEARALLQTIDHPTAREWLAKLDQVAPQAPVWGAPTNQPNMSGMPQYGTPPPQYGTPPPAYGAPQYGAPLSPPPYAGFPNAPMMPGAMPISDDTGGKAGASFLLLLTGLVGGVIGAALGGIIWVAIAVASNYEVPFMALLVGACAGGGVLLLSFGQRGIPFRILAVLIALLGIVLSKYLTAVWFVNFEGQTLNGDLIGRFIRTALQPEYIQGFFQNIGTFFHDPYDFAWLALAALGAWAILTPRRRRRLM